MGVIDLLMHGCLSPLRSNLLSPSSLARLLADIPVPRSLVSPPFFYVDVQQVLPLRPGRRRVGQAVRGAVGVPRRRRREPLARDAAAAAHADRADVPRGGRVGPGGRGAGVCGERVGEREREQPRDERAVGAVGGVVCAELAAGAGGRGR